MRPQDAGPAEDILVNRCLGSLRSLSPTSSVEWFSEQRIGDRKVDGEVRLKLGRSQRTAHFLVEVTRSHLGYPVVDGILGRLRRTRHPWLLFAPYVSPPMGRYLAARHVSYVDAVGNMHLALDEGREVLAHIEGRRQVLGEQGSSPRGPSHVVTFALLAQPELANEPVRLLAERTGTSKSLVASQLRRLEELGFLARNTKGLTLVRRKDLFARWLGAYSDTLRPRWLAARYHTKTQDPEALERELEGALAGQLWAFGGGAAAWRMNHYYRGEATVVHVAKVPEPLRVPALPSRDGNLVILATPFPMAFEGARQELAHPLLVYAEMLASDIARSRESAEEIREAFLPGLE